MSGAGSRWLSGLPIRAVIDTSVLMSAHRHAIWLLARDHYFYGIWNTFIVGELVRIRVEKARAHGQAREEYRERVNDLIHAFSSVLQVVPYSDALRPADQGGAGGALDDPDDDPVLASAVAGRAGYLVSLNTRDFPPGGALLGVRHVTPQDFFALLDAHYPLHAVSTLTQSAGKRVP